MGGVDGFGGHLEDFWVHFGVVSGHSVEQIPEAVSEKFVCAAC